MKVALIVGHSDESQGASNKGYDLSEFVFNDRLVADIVAKLNDVEYEIVYRGGYDTLPQRVNDTKADIAISFHCNAYNTEASGSEVLYYHSSLIGKHIAKLLQASLVQALGLPNRGAKAKHTEDRGGYLLRYTSMPCVIAEPFFIDNDSDLRTARHKYQELVHAYVTLIKTVGQHLTKA